MGSPRRATVCILTYGDYLDYFRRCLVSVLKFTPADEVELRLGFNNAPKSYQFALSHLAHPGLPFPPETDSNGIDLISFRTAGDMTVRIWNSPTNLFKEPVCRQMYWSVPLATEYVVWFDDDTFVEPGWWPRLCALFDRGTQYIGQRWWVTYLPGQIEMIQAMPWFRKVPFDLREGKPGIWFMTGGFIAIRAECIKQANFPDVEFVWKNDTLKQYGGDTLLGEIARQLSWTQADHDACIKVNVDLNGKHPAPRRGGTGRQFGSDVDIVLK